ncbi:MAG: hypothetical protein CMI67_17085 [Pelagibaca sp.]|nr:hypothetical protein [Pelagibaca sp.]
MDQVGMTTLGYFTISASVLCVITVASLCWVAAGSARMPRALRALSLLALAVSAVPAVLTLALTPLLAGTPAAEDVATLYSLPLDLGPLLPAGAAVMIAPKHLVWPHVLGLLIGLVLYAIGAIATPREELEAAPRKARLPMSKHH